MEMVVFPRAGTPMVDYLCALAGVPVAVSVTRAIAWGKGRPERLTVVSAVPLLVAWS